MPDTFVARVVVPVSKIEAGGSVQHYPLLNKKDEQIADVSLEMSITDGMLHPYHKAFNMILATCHLFESRKSMVINH